MAFKHPHGAHRNAGIPLTGVTWRDMEIADDDVAGVIFQDCVLERVRLARTSFWQTLFIDCRFDDCEFVDCRLFRTQWVNAEGTGIRIRGGEFAEAVFSDCRFGDLDVECAGERITFGKCTLGRLAFNADGCKQHGLTVSDCTLDAVFAENAAWSSASMVGVALDAWRLDGAVFDQCMFVEAEAAGVELSPVRFERCNLVRSNFREARIRQAPGSIFAECDCANADFAGAELDGSLFAKASAPAARFSGARLAHAMFPESNLVGANFSGASAQHSAWTGANLTEANFERVDAYRSTFRNAIFKDARMDGARLVESDLHGVEESLAGADLRDARGTLDWRAEREAGARLPPLQGSH